MLPSQLPIANKILAALPRSDYQRLLNSLELVDVAAGEVLCESGAPFQYVHFLNDALVSLLMSVDDTNMFAVGLVGREGMTSVHCALGAEHSAERVTVQSAGSALRMPARVFVQEFRDCTALRVACLKFVQTLQTQISETAACNRFHGIEVRLARWLLMTRDRLSSDHFHMTHETLGNLLGVRRVGVTNAAHALKLRGLIDYSRGAIDIIDGNGLREVACSCYRVVDGRHGEERSPVESTPSL